MPMMNCFDPNDYEIDFNHGIGCAFIADDEMLFRDEGDKDRDFLFQHLKTTAPSYAGTKLNVVIRDNLPEHTPKEIKDQFTAKSLRIGMITLCILCKSLSLIETAARSGHRIGGNMQTYIDMGCAVMALAAGMAVNGYPDPHDLPNVCSFDAVPDEEKRHIDTVVDKMLPTNMPVFKCALQPWLTNIAATLIMSYNDMLKKYGTADIVVKRMEDVFTSILGLGKEKLSQWSMYPN